MEKDIYTIELPISEGYDTDNGIIYVAPESEYSLKLQLQQFATFFKKEFKYDFLQYTANNHSSENEFAGFLFSELAYDRIEEDKPTPYRLYGGVGFFYRETIYPEPIWELGWIWLHPFFRHRGLLSRHWEYFKTQFGDFEVSQPQSPDMKNFLLNHR